MEEVISSLIYAAARCGEFPELQEIRSVFTSWFGKEFAARATELRSCGVNRKMVQKLSTRQPSLESRLQVLKEIASDNGISLQNEEGSLLITEEKLDVESRLNQPELDQPMNSGVPKLKDNSPILPEDIENEGLSDSMKGRRKYRDVAHAAQVAFESAAYAATAARAAVELSRSESYDPDDQSSPDSRPRNMFNTHEPIKNKLRTDQGTDSQGIEDMNVGMEFENFHSSQTYHSVSDDEETQMDTEGSKQNKNTLEIKRSLSGSSSDSADKILMGATFSPYIEDKTMAFGREMDFDGSDDENDNEQGGISLSKNHDLGYDMKHSLLTERVPRSENSNTIEDKDILGGNDSTGNYPSHKQYPLGSHASLNWESGPANPKLYSAEASRALNSLHLNLENRPMSVRNR